MNENKMETMPVNKLLITMAAPMVLSLLIGALLSRFLGERKQREVNQTNDVEIISMGVDYLTVICVFGFGQMIAMLLGLSTAVFGAYFKLQTFVYMVILGLNNALIPIVAFNLGAKHADRIKKVIRLSGAYLALSLEEYLL